MNISCYLGFKYYIVSVSFLIRVIVQVMMVMNIIIICIIIIGQMTFNNSYQGVFIMRYLIVDRAVNIHSFGLCRDNWNLDCCIYLKHDNFIMNISFHHRYLVYHLHNPFIVFYLVVHNNYLLYQGQNSNTWRAHIIYYYCNSIFHLNICQYMILDIVRDSIRQHFSLRLPYFKEDSSTNLTNLFHCFISDSRIYCYNFLLGFDRNRNRFSDMEANSTIYVILVK